MDKIILLNYYSDQNLERRKELIFCVKKNLNLNFINKIVIFIENKEEIKDLISLKNFKKIEFIITHKKRILTEDLFNFIKSKIKSPSIIIMMSCDIFLKKSLNWKNIDKNFFNKGYKYKILVGIRKNLYKKNLSKRQIEWEKKSSLSGDYFDIISFKTPLRKKLFNENFKFTWGVPCCDGLLMGILNKYYHIFSLGKKYISFHYDIVRKQNEQPKYTFNNIEINKNTIIDALLRVDEASRIPSDQNWNYLLKNSIKPNVVSLKENDSLLKKYIRKIYYYYKLKLLIIKSTINS
jgi:hypothetical protein